MHLPEARAAADQEESLLTGHLEPTNDAYAIAKIAGILQVQAVRRQYGLPWISAMPTNLYGPGDNFSPTGSHVLPALIRRYDEAKQRGASEVTNWGTGTPRREFLHVDDMADACLHLLEHYDGPEQVNVGTGEDTTIKEIAELVAEVVGYKGETLWDTSKPDGTPQKLLDVSKLARSGLDREDRPARGPRVDRRLVPRARRRPAREVVPDAPGLQAGGRPTATRPEPSSGDAPWRPRRRRTDPRERRLLLLAVCRARTAALQAENDLRGQAG